MRRLTSTLDADVTYYNIDRGLSLKLASRATWNVVQSARWDLIYQEGTGLAGGTALIRAALARRQRFIVSSGDPISGFFQVTKGPVVGASFAVYEKMLYRNCVGFVGWTPYLTGRALELGARRAVTVEGAVNLDLFAPQSAAERAATRTRYAIRPDHLVCGIVGSLKWTPRQSYCYGLELIGSLQHLRREDVSVLIVGDGDGKARLEGMVPDALRSRVIFTGRLTPVEVVAAMNAMDIGFITQTLDVLEAIV